ncbi:hypothetical protein [Halomonas tibetensis]|uniref:Uncharacterized protein n=1 Tax=Halomonas tibetensis TaxID=2259590 RepID=A0ABV7B7X6_9GAMM
MNRWLEKLGNVPDSELTKVPKGGSVSFGSTSLGAFSEKNASGNRWLAKLNKAPRHLEEVPPLPAPTVAEDSPLGKVVKPEPISTNGAPAPFQEVERIIEVLGREVGRDLGAELESLMRRAMGPLDRGTRATLAAEIDLAFETAQCIEQAREQAAQAICGRVGNPPPVTLADWLAWIEARCPINADDRHYLTDRLKWLAPAKLATTSSWYAQTWAKATATEPEAQRQENACRRAANASLLTPKVSTLVKAAHQPRQYQSGAPEPLPAGVRMSWTLRVDGKRLAIAGRPMTQEEALASAYARWPGADVDVIE